MFTEQSFFMELCLRVNKICDVPKDRANLFFYRNFIRTAVEDKLELLDQRPRASEVAIMDVMAIIEGGVR